MRRNSGKTGGDDGSPRKLRLEQLDQGHGLNVLMTTDIIGGAWTCAIDLCRELAQRGAAVTLVAMAGPMPRAARRDVAGIRSLSVIETKFRPEWMDDTGEDTRAAGEFLLSVARRLEPEVAHLNGFAHASLPWFTATGRRPWIVVVGHRCEEVRWRMAQGAPSDAPWPVYQRMVRAGIHNADVFVAPTRATLDAFMDCYGPHPRSCVIHHGRRGEACRPAEKRPIVFASGQLWDESENLVTLDAAAAAIAWPVYIAGDDRAPDGSFVAPRHTRHLGPLSPEALASAMGRAAIYALPARCEPSGVSVLEAALSGCALVLGDGAALRELWGDAAIYVPPGDPIALASAINQLTEDPARCAAFGAQARARASRYSAPRMAEDYLGLYRRMIGSQPAVPAPARAG